MVSVVEELRSLVAFPTVSNRPLLELAARLASRAEDAGFRVERFEPPGATGKCSVIASIGPKQGDGSGLVLGGEKGYVQIRSRGQDPFVKIVTGGGQERLIKP